jgi:hypothetical protein
MATAGGAGAGLQEARVALNCFPPCTDAVLRPPCRCACACADTCACISPVADTHTRARKRRPRLRYLGFTLLPGDQASWLPDERLCFDLGAHAKDGALSAAALAALTPDTATRLAFHLVSGALAHRVTAAYVLYCHAKAQRPPRAGALTAPHVLDALCTAASDVGGFRDGNTLALQLPSVRRAAAALGSGGALPDGRTRSPPPAQYAALLREQGVTRDVLLSPHDAVCAVKLTVALLSLDALRALLEALDEDAEARGDEACNEARTARLVAELCARGIVDAAVVLASHDSWAPDGGAALAPRAVCALYGDEAQTSATMFLALLQQRRLRRGVPQGVPPGDDRITDLLLALALTSGAASPRSSLQRGLAAFLLSFAAPEVGDKAVAVDEGALTWCVDVAADESYDNYFRCRALAGAGNIARAAHDVAQLAPLLALVRRLLTSHAADVATLVDDDEVGLIYNAAFIVNQLAPLAELRPWLTQHEDVRAALLQLLAAAHASRSPRLDGFVGLIQGRVLPMLDLPPPQHLRGDAGPIMRMCATPSRASPGTTWVLPERETAALLRHVCSGCGAEDAEVRFKKCSRCMAARYCSPECQRAHWKAHKKTCAAKKDDATPPPAEAAGGRGSSTA